MSRAHDTHDIGEFRVLASLRRSKSGVVIELSSQINA
jgi:hypothetical protein